MCNIILKDSYYIRCRYRDVDIQENVFFLEEEFIAAKRLSSSSFNTLQNCKIVLATFWCIINYKCEFKSRRVEDVAIFARSKTRPTKSIVIFLFMSVRLRSETTFRVTFSVYGLYSTQRVLSVRILYNPDSELTRGVSHSR